MARRWKRPEEKARRIEMAQCDLVAHDEVVLGLEVLWPVEMQHQVDEGRVVGIVVFKRAVEQGKQRRKIIASRTVDLGLCHAF